jgi:lysyl-tRNA synthetase class 1
VLLGQTEGPRFGQFAAIYGLDETIGLIDAALARAPAPEPAQP